MFNYIEFRKSFISIVRCFLNCIFELWIIIWLIMSETTKWEKCDAETAKWSCVSDSLRNCVV